MSKNAELDGVYSHVAQVTFLAGVFPFFRPEIAFHFDGHFVRRNGVIETPFPARSERVFADDVYRAVFLHHIRQQ